MRDYSKFELPYAVSHFTVKWLLLPRLRPYWHLLSFELATKINEALEKEEGATITKEDLDSLSDEAWAELEKNI